MREFSSPLSLALAASLFLVFSLGFLAPPSVQARLGDSPKQCIKRYGTPTGDTEVPGLIPNGTMFQRGEYSITCGFENDVCVVVVVLRHAPDNPDIHTIPRGDISLFMQENFGKLSWNFTKFSDLESIWKTKNWEEQVSYEATFAPSLQMLTLRRIRS